MSVVMYRWCDVRLLVWWNVQMFICTDRQVDKSYAGAARRLSSLGLHAGAGSAGAVRLDEVAGPQCTYQAL